MKQEIEEDKKMLERSTFPNFGTITEKAFLPMREEFEGE